MKFLIQSEELLMPRKFNPEDNLVNMCILYGSPRDLGFEDVQEHIPKIYGPPKDDEKKSLLDKIVESKISDFEKKQEHIPRIYGSPKLDGDKSKK